MFVDSLFPTTILRKEDVLEDKDNFMDHIELGQRHSTSDIHTTEPFKPLANSVLELANAYAQYMNWGCDLYISSMWYNVNKQHEDHAPHTHSNSLLSGVYYPQSEISNHSPIEFIDQRNRFAIAPTVLQHNVQNSDSWQYEAKANSLIMFPAWLQHWVPVNLHKEPRISVSFNVMLKGTAGVTDALTGASYD